MLNLEILERKLDEALAKETKESMTSWLLHRRIKKYISSLGDGKFVSMPSNHHVFTQSKGFTIEGGMSEFSTELSFNSNLLICAAA